MNGDKGGRRRLRHICAPRMGMLAAVAGIALLTAACGGGSANPPDSANSRGSATSPRSSASSDPGTSATAGGSSTYNKAVAYAQCMRSHGVPNFPDPLPNGGFGLSPAVTGGTNGQVSPQYQTAERACASLSPVGNQSPQQQRQALNRLLKVSACMRSHGYPTFPDPTFGSDGIFLHIVGFDRSSPQFQAAWQTCQSALGPGAGGGL
jgi:hypothetical protein